MVGAIPSILEHLPVLAAGRWVGRQGRPPLYLDREAQGGLRGSQGWGGEGPRVEEGIPSHPVSLSSGTFSTTRSQESGEGRIYYLAQGAASYVGPCAHGSFLPWS